MKTILVRVSDSTYNEMRNAASETGLAPSIPAITLKQFAAEVLESEMASRRLRARVEASPSTLSKFATVVCESVQ